MVYRRKKFDNSSKITTREIHNTHLTESVLSFSQGRLQFSVAERALWPEADQQIIACTYAILKDQTNFSTSIEIYCDDSDVKIMSLLMMVMYTLTNVDTIIMKSSFATRITVM